VGSILPHEYLVAGILPVRITLSTLLCILLGPTTLLPQDILMNAILDFVTNDEKTTIPIAKALTFI